jgi:hypothetical protein
MLNLLQDGMKAVLERICLQELVARRRTEQKAGSACTDEIFQHRPQGRAKIHILTPEQS